MVGGSDRIGEGSKPSPFLRDAGKSPGQRKSTMEERLAKMRIEDRRRTINEQARNTGRRLNAGAPVFQPFSQSASARAGTMYYASSDLRERDAVKSQRQHALRRKFAGPTPPSSWQADPSDTDGEAILSEEEKALNTIRHQTHREHALATSRRFFMQGDEWTGSSTVKTPPSLVDACLCNISRHLSEVTRGNNTNIHSLDVYSIPIHLKERLMALSGRLMVAPSFSEQSIHALFSTNREADEEDKATSVKAETGEDEFEGLPDSWDALSCPEDDDDEILRDHASCHFVDLSYAMISSRAVRMLLQQSCIRPDSIRALNLAGWGGGGGGNGKNGSVRVSLRSSTGLLNTLDKLSNLRCLSLADSRLLDEVALDAETGGLSQHAVFEAIAFLKKLSRRTVRLEVLDLSCCAWIDGAVIANAGWYTTSVPIRRLAWPRMKDLVLAECPAFMSDKTTTTTTTESAAISITESSAFVGSWHAAHHGVAWATKSPYFSAHKPGLGRAVLADGVGVAWDSASARGALVERQAAALTEHRRSMRAGHMRSAFDDGDGEGATNETFAISHGVAPFASRRVQSVLAGRMRSSDDLKPRCPVSTSRVEHHEWQRARVLDAVHGRWGSAIVGNVLSDEQSRSGDGSYVTVYF